jgi:hypothetical protein
MTRCELAELGSYRIEPRGHEVEKLAGAKPERRPVELFVREQAVVLGAAAAVEPHPEDSRMSGARQPLNAEEGRQRHVRLAPYRTRERVAARQRVVDRDVVETAPDEAGVLST